VLEGDHTDPHLPSYVSQGLLEEATQKKALMESLCERCETLMVYCAYRPVRDQTLGLQTRHCSVLAQLQVLTGCVQMV
jgi:hypothetical protein